MAELKGYRRGYVICEAPSVGELSARVQIMIGNGFVPLGGIACSGAVGVLGAGGFQCYQVMWSEVPVYDEEPATGPKLVTS